MSCGAAPGRRWPISLPATRRLPPNSPGTRASSNSRACATATRRAARCSRAETVGRTGMKHSTLPIAASLKRCARLSALAIAVSLAWQASASAAQQLTPRPTSSPTAPTRQSMPATCPSRKCMRRAPSSFSPEANSSGCCSSTYRREGKVDEADSMVESLFVRFPKSAAVRAQHGYLAQRQMRYDVACSDFAAAVATGNGARNSSATCVSPGRTARSRRSVRMKPASRWRRWPMKNRPWSRCASRR